MSKQKAVKKEKKYLNIKNRLGCNLERITG